MGRQTKDLFTAAYWQQRAENARRIAKMLGETQAAELMLGVASDYERLAHRAATDPHGLSLLADEPDYYPKDGAGK